MVMRAKRICVPLLAAADLAVSVPTLAQHDAEHLAKELANPVAALISVPFQLNYDPNVGPGRDGDRWTLNIQPVVPVSISQDWNVISRTVLPVINQDDIALNSANQFGLGDTVQSFFFSPKKPTADGIIWGVGPALLLPTGTDDLLGSGKWGLGPTAVVLKQHGPWTYGALANHIWSVAGSSSRADVSSTYLQPFVAHTTKDAWTYSLNTESTYDWKSEQWTVPINAMVSKLMKIDGQHVSFGGGVRYYVDSPDNGSKGWGVRLIATLLFPK